MRIAKSGSSWLTISAVLACSTLALHSHPAEAFVYTFGDGVVINFNNNLEYSVVERTSPVSPYFANNPNQNDGDLNLRAGIVSNKVDLLSEFNITYNGFGFDGSVHSFYDTVYNQRTQNNDDKTYNPTSVPPGQFTTETRTIEGRNIELRNLFVFGSGNIGGIPITVRVGRFVNIFGESLLFAGNGISYGQSPIDIVEATSVPNTPAKNLFLPVGQAEITAQLNSAISVSAYYQFEWEKFNYPAAGSYFSPLDFYAEGGERLFVGQGVYLGRGPDQSGKSTGQYGIAVHYDPLSLPVDFGFYALQFNDTEPQVYARPGTIPSIGPNGVQVGNYNMVYANGIQIYGASTSFTVGPTNYAGEVSIRKNEDLTSTVTLAPNGTPGANPGANGSNDPAYAIGNVLHYQASALFAGKGTRLWDGSSILAEAAGNNLLAITKNRENFISNATPGTPSHHMAFGIRSIFGLTYYEVAPGLDLNPSIGVGWNFMGLSSDTQGFNNTGIDRGGDLTFGMTATYRNVWIANLDYTTYVSPPAQNPYADRDFVSFSVQREF